MNSFLGGRRRAILLTTLIIATNLFAQERKFNQIFETTSEKSRTNFSAAEAEKLIEQISAEAEKRIEQAFNEGYKAATVFYSPKIQSYELKIESLTFELQKEKQNRLLIPLCSVAGAGLGFCGGLLLLTRSVN